MLSERSQIPLCAALIAALTVIAFSSSLDNGFVNWDDGLYVTANPLIRDLSWDNLKEILSTFYRDDYRLITVLLSYTLEYRLFGLDPFIYHLDNLVLHVLNTLLVFYLVLKLSGRLSVALATSLLFGVHPVHVEAVAWVSERKGLLSAFFFLGAIILYLRYHERSRRVFYYLSLAAFLLSVLSKLVAVTLPVVLLLVDYLSCRTFTRKTLTEKVPFFVLSGVFAVDTVFMYKAMGQFGSIEPLSAVEVVLLSCRSLTAYLAGTVLPVNLSAIYPYPAEISIGSPAFFLPPVILAALAVAVVYSMKYTRTVVFGALFFLITLSPVLKVVPFASGGSTMADRYMYVPSVGLLFLAGLAFHGLYARAGALGRASRVAAAAGLGVAVVAGMYLTHQRGEVWKDSETLWQSVIERHPESSFARYNLANAYAKLGRFEEATEEYRLAIALDPDFKDSRFNLANAYAKLGRYDQAAEEYLAAIRLDPADKDSHFNLAQAYLKLGRFEEAAEEYRLAIALDPGFEDAHFNLGNLLARLGRFDQAVGEYKKALALDPQRADIHNNLGIVYARSGAADKAVRAFREALRIDPDLPGARRNLERAQGLR
ncbi:MAG: tetratricopeptide repeat protein [Thermodesulfobacteriota bacterium]